MRTRILIATVLSLSAASCEQLDETEIDDALLEETPEPEEADVEDCFPKHLCSKPDLAVVGGCHPDANNVGFEFYVKNVGTAVATGYVESEYRYATYTPHVFGTADLQPGATFRVPVYPYRGGTVGVGPNPITISYKLDKLGVLAEGTAGEKNNSGSLYCE
ncbi:MAG: hypothetical protein JNL21_29900 [Myxococcales bacterium]|nr:hypothetical protein [Myxococcales bacterium]